ncbi:MAG: SURF1 family protein [Parvibaculaceae bacterium]
MRGRNLAFLVFSLAALALCLALGFWQVERLEWKRAILAQMRERMAGEPFSPADVESRLRAGEDIEFLRVGASGRFGEGQVRYFASHDGMVGWHLVSPFQTTDGETVLVDRGFVPDRALAEAAPAPKEPVTLTGIARAHADGRGFFTPADKPAEGIFYAWSPAAMAEGLHAGQSLGFILHAEPAPGAPQWPSPRLPDPASIPNNHLQYAITWFGLALALAVITLLQLRRLRRPS